MQTQITTPTPRYLLELEKDPHLVSHHTRRQYGAILTRFVNWLDGRKFTLTVTEEYVAILQQQGDSKGKIKKILAVIRWWARRVIKIARDELPEAQADDIEKNLLRVCSIEDPKGANTPGIPAGRHLESGEVKALLESCKDGTLHGIRDGAFIAVAAGAFLRNEEIREIKMKDIKYGPGGAYATIPIPHGKGDKARVVELFGQHLDALNAWIKERGIEGEYLFTRIRRGGVITTGAPITYAGTRIMLEKRFRASALSTMMTWHDFRRTGIGLMFSAGYDIATIMNISGHTSEKTARGYDRRPGDERRKALKEIQEQETWG